MTLIRTRNQILIGWSPHNYQAQLSEQPHYNQQNQWKEFDQAAGGEPPEGERGLGATVVGGAGVCTTNSIAHTKLTTTCF
jgi:hypothetical protein